MHKLHYAIPIRMGFNTHAGNRLYFYNSFFPFLTISFRCRFCNKDVGQLDLPLIKVPATHPDPLPPQVTPLVSPTHALPPGRFKEKLRDLSRDFLSEHYIVLQAGG